MIHQRRLMFAGILLAAFFFGCTPREKTVSMPGAPVSYQHIVRQNPNFSIHVVTMDLSDPRVSVHIAKGGSDPDGNGPWTTTLMPTSEIAEREHFDIAINGDFFTAKSTEDVEGKNTGYVRGKFASPVGWAMTEGQIWHRSSSPKPYLEITATSVARFQDGRNADPSAREMISGSQMLVINRQPIAYTTKFALDRHPRTAVGTALGGKQLLLVVVDGRQPQLSVGMTLAELAHEMVSLGCEEALNLDGGGSSTLVFRSSDTKKLEIVNSPSDTIERSVADILGVKIAARSPAAK